MKNAIIKTGGKQIKVHAGAHIWVEKLNTPEKEKHTFTEVLSVYDGTSLHIGKPMLKAEVHATVEKHGRGEKIRILKFKNKSNWERRQGHRQPFTKLLINEIILDGKSIDKADKAHSHTTEKTSKKNSKVKEVELTK